MKEERIVYYLTLFKIEDYKMWRIHTSTNKADFDRDYRDWEWRLREMSKVSYNYMVYSFRSIKPESFYKDTSFLTEARPVRSPIQLMRV
jgi:hypothetical protein